MYFFIINNVAITPGLGEATILEGVTRDSAITLLNEMGMKVEERSLSIDEVIEAHKKGVGIFSEPACPKKLPTPFSLTVAGYASWGICSITQKKKSVTGCSIPNRLSLAAT